MSTNNLPGLAKTFIRTGGASGDITRGAVSSNPTNSIDDRRLIDNPFETLAGSQFLVVKFDPADASHFIGNVGRKCQLRTTGSTASMTVGGIDIAALSQSGWLTIQAESAVNNTITVQNSTNATAGTTGGGTGNYLALVKPEEKLSLIHI